MAEPLATTKLIYEKARAGYPAIYLVSSEDMRSQRDIKEAAKELDRTLYIWTYGKGLVEDGKKTPIPIMDTEKAPAALTAMLAKARVPHQEKAIFVLRLFNHWMREPIIQSQLLDIIPEFKVTKRTLIIVSPVIELPPEIEKEFALVESQLPGRKQLKELIHGIKTGGGLPKERIPTDQQESDIIEAAMGLTTTEAENAFALSVVRPTIAKSTNFWDPKIVMEEKCQALKKTGLLTYVPVSDNSMNQVGGLDVLKSWVGKRKNFFTEDAKKFGVPSPKGILLVGPPGCGKSLTAKAVGSELSMPLLRLDVGKMFGSLVGQSEANIRAAIQVAEANAPCVLWIDEIEKGFAGANAGSLDSGVGARVLGTVLTWMQETEHPVFVYATANDVSHLPGELLRRFDETFSVDLPNQEEREEILTIQLRKKKREHLITKPGGKVGGIDLKHFSGQTSEGHTGAEIEKCINEAMYSAFENKRELNSVDLQDAFDSMPPLSKTMSEKIEAIRTWCKDRTRPATTPMRTPVIGGRNVDSN